jgi:hypothetical protein
MKKLLFSSDTKLRAIIAFIAAAVTWFVIASLYGVTLPVKL